MGHVHAFIEDGKRTVRGCAAGGVTKRPDKKEQGEDDKVRRGEMHLLIFILLE